MLVTGAFVSQSGGNLSGETPPPTQPTAAAGAGSPVLTPRPLALPGGCAGSASAPPLCSQGTCEAVVTLVFGVGQGVPRQADILASGSVCACPPGGVPVPSGPQSQAPGIGTVRAEYGVVVAGGSLPF